VVWVVWDHQETRALQSETAWCWTSHWLRLVDHLPVLESILASFMETSPFTLSPLDSDAGGRWRPLQTKLGRSQKVPLPVLAPSALSFGG
jgi:hypothetical protein